MADFDYQKMHDYVSADPEVTKLRKQRTTAHQKIKIQKELARRNIEKMHGLYLAKTAVYEKLCVEPPDSPVEESYVEELTGQCAECWSGDWQEALETVFDGQLSVATAISNIAKLIYKYSEEVNLITGCLDTLEDELRKQFRTQFYKDQQNPEEVEL